MISIFFCDGEVVDFETAGKGDTPYFKNFFHKLVENGVYIAPSSYETWFITDALTYDDLDETIRVIDKVTAEI